MLILHTLDFDETITKNHTAQKPQDFKPENNIKDGLKGRFVHNNESLLAIATYHSQPTYVLSYLLYLLEKTEEDIVKTEEVIIDNHHQLFKVFLADCTHPLIIATPRKDNYNSHLHALSINGKNDLLHSIVAHLPACHEKHYYEDKELYFDYAACLPEFHRHHVQATNPSFSFHNEKAPGALFSLRSMLAADLAELTKDAKKETQPSSHVSLSLFSISANNSTLPDSSVGLVSNVSTSTPSAEETINALCDLINFIDFKVQTIESNTLAVLANGSFKDTLAYWEMQTKEKITKFIPEVLQKREEVAKLESTYNYDSDENTGLGY
ncbi:hypothetical protein [Legionella hackeliae]|uniref:Uncharacterized protein n=1 Tax=Legionella hackeliae TaxID=449 RepID=A0A0A8UK18_LEGHA|nr:hypothetical protein [Legionella hackeliae]KTD12882.1 hypothetical protein Lhac_1753 [Legionella hackeliae]CEK09190.1 protein of unknown function [Legionella hackeliae]STX49098.1 Uncharacterised protein [Legionella hackeliae]